MGPPRAGVGWRHQTLTCTTCRVTSCEASGRGMTGMAADRCRPFSQLSASGATNHKSTDLHTPVVIYGKT